MPFEILENISPCCVISLANFRPYYRSTAGAFVVSFMVLNGKKLDKRFMFILEVVSLRSERNLKPRPHS